MNFDSDTSKRYRYLWAITKSFVLDFPIIIILSDDNRDLILYRDYTYTNAAMLRVYKIATQTTTSVHIQ